MQGLTSSPSGASWVRRYGAKVYFACPMSTWHCSIVPQPSAAWDQGSPGTSEQQKAALPGSARRYSLRNMSKDPTVTVSQAQANLPKLLKRDTFAISRHG